MKKCKITIRTATGKRSYVGIFKTTIDATLSALDRANEICSIKVEMIK
jgi:hypothetical protein